MVLFITKATFQHRASYLAQYGTHLAFQLLELSFLTLGNKAGGDIIFSAIPPVLVGGINSISRSG